MEGSRQFEWHKRALRACFAGLIVLIPGQAAAEGAVSPNVIELVVQPGGSDRANFLVQLPPAAPSYEPLDVVFVFDATASMGDVINDFQRSVGDILANIAGRSRNVRYAVVEFGDYPGLSPNCSGAGANAPIPVWRLATDFTADPRVASGAVSTIGVHWNGCDWPEAYLRALEEVRHLGWRADATRYVVLLGDAPPRIPDPGLDGILGTADDLDTAALTEAYRRDGISLLGIYSTRGDASQRRMASEAFNALAGPTPNGQALPLDQGRRVADVIEQGMVRILPPPPTLRPASGEFRNWVGEGERDGRDADGMVHGFLQTITVPEGTESGIYDIDFVALAGPNGTGGVIGTSRVTLRVGWRFYPIKPMLFWTILLLCLAAILWLLAKKSRTQTWGLKYGGRAFRQGVETIGAVVMIAALGVLAYRAAPEDIHGLRIQMDELADGVQGAISKLKETDCA